MGEKRAEHENRELMRRVLVLIIIIRAHHFVQLIAILDCCG